MSRDFAWIDLGLFYRLAPAFVAGVGLVIYGHGEALLLAAAAALLGALVIARKHPDPYRAYLPFALLLIAAAVAGGVRAGLFAPRVSTPPVLETLEGRWVRALATTEGHPKASHRGVRVAARLSEIRIRTDEGWEAIGGEPLAAIVSVEGERNAWLYSAGAVLEVTGYLRRPSHSANPGVHSYRDYLEQQRLFAVLYVDSPWRARVRRWPEGLGAALGKTANEFSRWVGQQAGERGALVRALAVGDRGGVDEQFTEALRASGTSHVLAISGLHMAVAGTFFFFLVRTLLLQWSWLALRLPVRKVAMIAALAGVVLYALLTGASESTQRAAVMFAAAAGALLLERRFSALRAIILAATVLLLVEPRAFAGISFQLSFSAALAIIVVFRLIAPWWSAEPTKDKEQTRLRRLTRRIGRGAAAIAVSSVAANLATGPLAAYYFGRLSLNGIAANLLVLPLVELLLLPASLLSFVLWSFWPRAAALALVAAGTSAAWVERIVRFVSEYLPLELGFALPGALDLALYFGGFALIAVGAHLRARRVWAVGAAALSLLAVMILFGKARPDDLEVQALDVGRARVTLARWADGRAALVDQTRAGSFPYVERRVLPALRAQRLSEVDLLIFAGSGEGAQAALESYGRALSPKEIWRVEKGAPQARRWPEAAPRVELLAKGTPGAPRGWAAALQGAHGRYVVDGAYGYWPQSWARLWKSGRTAVEFSAGALRARSNRWLLARLRPDLVVLPQGNRADDEPLALAERAVSRGWTRVRFGADALEIEHAPQ